MKKKIAILGAGVCGLALAYFLQKRFASCVDITIFEAKDRPGGWLHTITHNGALFECGPRSLRSTTSELFSLLDELELTNEVIYASNAATKRYIVSDGKLEALPTSVMSLFSTKLGRQLLYAAIKEPFFNKGVSDDESVERFFLRRIGKHATDTFISALAAGIYAASPAELSMRSCFQTFWEQEKQYGSLVKAFLFSEKKDPIRSFSFRGGMGTLPRRLQDALTATIYYNKEVKRVQEFENKVVVEVDMVYEFDHVYSTITPNSLAAMLSADDPLKPLLSIPSTSLVTVSCAFRDPLNIPSGFGFLCPENEDPALLGMVFDSEIFPEQNGGYLTRLSVMMGGTRCPDMVLFSDDVLLAYVKKYLKKYLQSDKPLDHYIIMRAPSAISRYPVGHHRTVSTLDAQNRRITLLGSGLYGVSVGDSITSAASVVYKNRISL